MENMSEFKQCMKCGSPNLESKVKSLFTVEYYCHYCENKWKEKPTEKQKSDFNFVKGIFDTMFGN